MNTPHFTGTPPIVHTTARVDLSHLSVHAIDGAPGRYAVELDKHGLNLHVTAAQWDALDKAVRAGILAAQTKAIS